MTSLRTPRLRLEFVTPALARLAAHGRAPLEAAIGARVHEAWIGDHVFRTGPRVLVSEAPRHALVILEAEGLLVGDLRFEVVGEGVFEIGYAIAPGYRRQGLATEAAGRIIRWLDEDVGALRIIAGCAMANRASVRTLRRLGFDLDGSSRDGDAFWWVWSPAGPGGL